MGSAIALPLTLILELLPVSIADGVYKCKWIISFIYIEIYRYLHRKRFDIYDIRSDDPETIGAITPRSEFGLESPFPESHLLKAKDEIFFYGVNSKNERLIVSISRRCDQRADARIYLRLASGKTYHLVRTTDVEQVGVDSHVFSCGQLQLHYMNPMRKWRIFYNGFLRETDENGVERIIYVKFALIWGASSNVYDFSEDINTKVLAKGLASVEWNSLKIPFSRFKKALNAYGQSGVIQGTITIGDEIQDYEIYLFGQRMRDLGSNLSFKNIEFRHFLGFVEKNGIFIHLSELSISDSARKLSFGYIVRTDTSMNGVNRLSVKSNDTTMEGGRIDAKFTVDKSYELNGVLRRFIGQGDSNETIWTDSLYETSFDLNGKKGSGIYLKRALSEIPSMKTSYKPTLNIPKVIPRTVTFPEVACQIPEITGGKGSSLGKLTSYSKELQTFIVPEGIVVTTSSYEEIITRDIVWKIKLLEDILYGNVEGDVRESCERVREAISESEFPSSVQSSIERDLKKVFGENISKIKFAVRSSATGEDTEQMSAAGQMDTFLGISGLEEIIQAVKKCWASQFGYVAVQYKRRYGQSINSPMAVVIQRMIACDVAGVLFTCDPLSGNPSIITITANYGLGESVVSGSEEPDTILLERDINNDLRVKTTDVGAKSNRIIMKDDGGTSEENVSEYQKNVCCISEQMALRLGHLAVKIEKHYKSARDIEWGFHNNNLYIFQSRPVTSGTTETVYELDHEFDAPMRTEKDYFSISNVGEVLPAAVSPLGLQLFFDSFRYCTLRDKQTEFQMDVPHRYYRLGFCVFYNHSIFNVADLFHNMDGDHFDNTTKATLIAFFGRVPDDKDLFELVKERYGDYKRPRSWKTSLLFIKNLAFSRRVLEKTLKIFEGYRLPVEKCSSSKELLNLILQRSVDFGEAFMSHLICSQMSSIWNNLVLSIISEENGCFDDNVYRDFANLLRNTNEVESADVPEAMQNLALHISQAMDPKEFKSKTPEEALNWLQNSCSSAGKHFRQFLEKHGHRCLKEFDAYSTTWEADPKPLVKLLQNFCGNVTVEDSEKKKNIQNEPELQVKMGILANLKLRFLLPISRRAVQDRESTKSLLVKVMNGLRKGCRELAKRMVSEGRIPEEDIMFFMTAEEIRDLLETRSPKILAKASQRQRRHLVLDKYIFPEMMKGQPRPINEIEDINTPTSDDFSMKGIPVSQGMAKGYVRKAMTVEEATNLRPGEILLTYSTDIGWTPYFPTLAGVVTELGGLISHGAVVSREFGIPCIAGMHGATRYFQTGDYVLLDGNKGVLQKISPPKC